MMQEEKASQLYPHLPAGGDHSDLNGLENGRAGQGENGRRKDDPPPAELPFEVKDYKYFWKRVLKDMTNKNLIPVKILFFFKYATLFVLYPFLTLHMDALGLDEWEIGVNQASVPIVAILGPPVSGMIADKIGNFKVVLAFITLVNAAVSLLLLLVPVARETVQLPATITFELGCSPSSNFILSSIDDHLCSLNSSHFRNLPNSLLQCGRLCPFNSNETDSTGDLPAFPLHSNQSYRLNYQNSSKTFYASLASHPSFICDGSKCQINVKYEIGESGDSISTADRSEDHGQITFKQLSLVDGLKNGSPQNHQINVTRAEFQIDGPIIFGSELHDNPRCGAVETLDEESDASGCETKCLLQMKRDRFCANESERKVYDVGLTFGLYTVFRLLLGFASATSFIMFEGAVLAILKQYGGDYGLQRVSATFAAIIAAPFSGFLLQRYSFHPVFYLYAALQAFSAMLTLKIDLKFKKPSDNVLGYLKDVLSQVEILIFFLAMLCSGTLWGYLETFLFLFLKQLGGSKTLMGLTISVGGIFGLPFLVFSRPLIKRVGHVNILCIGFLFYAIRYFGYSLIENPWLCLPFEALESITASLAITAAATYAVALSTLQTIATVQGIMGALYFGIGRGAGSFVGGILIKKLGHRQTFQVFGLSAIVACLLYTLANILYIRRHSKASEGLDINHENGLVISNPTLGKQSKDNEQIQMKPKNHDSDLGYGKINPGFEEGGDGSEDGNPFTDIPLDEENSIHQPRPNNNNQVKR